MDIPNYADIDTEEIEIHGKLCHLDAIDLSKLSLAKRYAMITMSGPWISDDYGRFTTPPGGLPLLPALTDRQAQAAVKSLIDDGLLKTWPIDGSIGWEVAGAYAFKPGLKAAMEQRKALGRRKKKEKELRRARKAAADAGIPFALEDDGTFKQDASHVELVRTERGNLVPPRPTFWYRSKVRVPKGQQRDKILVKQPDKAEGIKLRLLPSFNPGAGLSQLGTVLRHYLLLECDDYGRVRVDVPQLYRVLGKPINKYVTKADIKAELAKMDAEGHLKIFKRTSGTFAYLRDSAQHRMEKKRYDRTIPKLVATDREFTLDSDAYLAFFKACEDQAASGDLVPVTSYSRHGRVYAVREKVGLAAKRFRRQYEDILKREPYSLMTAAQFCGLEPWKNVPRHFDLLFQFWHAVRADLPLEQLQELYFTHQEKLDGAGSGGEFTHKLLKYLLGKTPQAYVAGRRGRANAGNDQPHQEPSGDGESAQSSLPAGPPTGDTADCSSGDRYLDEMAAELDGAHTIAVEMEYLHPQYPDQTSTSDIGLVLSLQRFGGTLWEIRIGHCQPQLGPVLRRILGDKTMVAHGARPILRWLQESFGFMPAHVRCSRTAARLLSNGTGHDDHHDFDSCVSRYLESGASQGSDIHAGAVLSTPGDSRLDERSRKVRRVHELHSALSVQITVAAMEHTWRIENSALRVIAGMEVHGIPIDQASIERLVGPHDVKTGRLLDQIHDRGDRFQLLFDPLGTVFGQVTPNVSRLPDFLNGPLITAVRAPDGCKLVRASFADPEIRILAAESGDTAMIESFARGGDFFRQAAATLFAKCEEHVTDDERRILRFLFLSFVHDSSMSDTIEQIREAGITVSLDTGDRFQQMIMQEYRGVWARYERLFDVAKRPVADVRTRHGRRLLIPDGTPESKRRQLLLSMPVLGGLADGTKTAMALVQDRLPQGARLILGVGEELVVECPTSIADDTRAVVVDAMVEGMTSVFPEVRFEVEARICQSLAE